MMIELAFSIGVWSELALRASFFGNIFELSRPRTMRSLLGTCGEHSTSTATDAMAATTAQEKEVHIPTPTATMSHYKRNLGSYGYSDDEISRFLAPYIQQQRQQQQGSFGGLDTAATKRLKTEVKEIAAEEIQAPQASMTGVSESLLRICAKLSHKIYKASTKQELARGLRTDGLDVEVLLLDTHGVLQTTTPPFAVTVVPSLQTLVLVWRGSLTKMDWIVDFSVAPVLSESWRKAAPQIRAHAGYTALVESDLSMHSDFLIKEVEKRGITQIIVTGHSLAGAMAQIAQVAIQGQVSASSSLWNTLDETKLDIRCVQFGAPMSCMLLDEEEDEQSQQFWDKLSLKSCNLVFASDMLPRAPGNFRYVDAAVRQALVPFVKDVLEGMPIMALLDLFPSALQKLVDLYQDETKKKDVVDIIKECLQFQHVGSIIWYASLSTSPIKLDDYQFRTNVEYQFNIPQEEPYPNRKLKRDHVMLPDALAHDSLKK